MMKCLIFDMDGVILDSEPLHEEARQLMYQEMNITVDESFPNPVGRSCSGFWKEILEMLNMPGDCKECQTRQYDLVAKLIEEKKVPTSDGLLEILEWAKSNNIIIGLASSSTRRLVDETLRILKIADYFDYTVSGDEVTKKKPSPEPYLRVLELAGVSPNCAVAVEDSRSGVTSAKAAGLYCFGYVNPTSGNQDLSNADRLIQNLNEIKESYYLAIDIGAVQWPSYLRTSGKRKDDP